jgi:hypothetical protein
MKNFLKLAILATTFLGFACHAQPIVNICTQCRLISTPSLTLNGTTTTGLIRSNISAATATNSIAAVTLKPFNVLDANDLFFDIQTSAAASVFKVDFEGDTTMTGSLAVGGNITTTSTFNLGSSSIGWGTVYFGAANANGGIFGNRTDNAAAIGLRISNPGYSTSTARITTFENADVVKAGVTPNGFYVQPAQTVTVADDGNGGTAPALVITPSSSTIKVAYNDPTNNGDGSISETGAVEGSWFDALYTGTGGTVLFDNISNQQKVGAVVCGFTIGDTMHAVYLNSVWYITCKDND